VELDRANWSVMLLTAGDDRGRQSAHCSTRNRYCRSQAWHLKKRLADIERAKTWGLVHLRPSKGEARRAEPTVVLWFRGKAPKEANG